MRSARPNVSDPGRIVAHRGASMVAPENTLGAFRSAADQGAHWVEFDVSLLGDATPVVHHDDTLDRCTSGRGPLASIAARDLSAISAGAGEALPTLDDALETLDALEMFANLEMKPHDQPVELIADCVANALLERRWTAHRMIVSSFSVSALAAIRRKMPDIPIAVLFKDPPPDWLDILASVRAAAVHIHFTKLSQSLLAEASEHRVDVRVYTVNDPVVLAPFRDLGLTGVITDHPPLFLDDPAWAAWSKRP